MTIQEQLTALKASNTEFATLVNTGKDFLAAAMATELLDKNLKSEAFYTELGIIAAFDDPVAGETLLQTLEAIGNSNAVVKRMLKWIQPGAPGIDFANSAVRANITALKDANALTTSQANTLLGLGLEKVKITPEQIAGIR